MTPTCEVCGSNVQKHGTVVWWCPCCGSIEVYGSVYQPQITGFMVQISKHQAEKESAKAIRERTAP